MSIITDEMVEKAVRAACGDFDEDYIGDIRRALEAVANDIIEVCAQAIEENGLAYINITPEENAVRIIRSLKK